MATNTVRVAVVAMPIDIVVLKNVGLVDGRAASLFYCLDIRCNTAAFLNGVFL